jgi:hypothetical protein
MKKGRLKGKKSETRSYKRRNLRALVTWYGSRRPVKAMMAVRFFEFLQQYRSQGLFHDDRRPCNVRKIFLNITRERRKREF